MHTYRTLFCLYGQDPDHGFTHISSLDEIKCVDHPQSLIYVTSKFCGACINMDKTTFANKSKKSLRNAKIAYELTEDKTEIMKFMEQVKNEVR